MNTHYNMSKPEENNQFQAGHVELIRRNHQFWTGQDLFEPGLNAADFARSLYHAPFVLLTHDANPDPVFTYANEKAQSLFNMSWEEMTTYPSRLSATEPDQASRERFLKDVEQKGYSNGYQGVRITRDGRRFEILDAIVWNLLDQNGTYCGQAASFAQWRWL